MMTDTAPTEQPSACAFPLVLTPQMRRLVKAHSEAAKMSQSKWIRCAIEAKVMAENQSDYGHQNSDGSFQPSLLDIAK